MPLPPPTIHTEASTPLRFSDGYTRLARVFSFDGLADGREHVAFGLGDRAAPVTSNGNLREPLVRPHSECLTGDVFGSPMRPTSHWATARTPAARPLRVTVTARVPTGVDLSTANARYLATKARRGGHTLDVPPPAG